MTGSPSLGTVLVHSFTEPLIHWILWFDQESAVCQALSEVTEVNNSGYFLAFMGLHCSRVGLKNDTRMNKKSFWKLLRNEKWVVKSYKEILKQGWDMSWGLLKLAGQERTIRGGDVHAEIWMTIMNQPWNNEGGKSISGALLDDARS